MVETEKAADEIPGIVYVASPYQHEDPEVMEQRFESVCKYVSQLYQKNIIAYSPIAHNHPIAVRHTLPRGWDFWCQFDTAFLNACQRMEVLRLDGWEESKGIKAEIEIMMKLGKPVDFVDLVEVE